MPAAAAAPETGLERRAETTSADEEEPPFCSLGVVALCVINFNESVAVNVIWPFLPFAVVAWGAAPEDIGTYVGWVASSFFASQLATAGLWGLFADAFGRKPALMLGLVGSATAMIALGFAQTLQGAIACRILAGLTNGNIGVTKVMVSEQLSRRQQARAMALLSFNWGAGSVVGPIAGGFLTAKVLAETTGYRSEFLDAFPYAIPCFFSALVSMIGLLLGGLYLPESQKWLQSRQAPAAGSSRCAWLRRRKGQPYAHVPVSAAEAEDEDPKPPAGTDAPSAFAPLTAPTTDEEAPAQAPKLDLELTELNGSRGAPGKARPDSPASVTSVATPDPGPAKAGATVAAADPAPPEDAAPLVPVTPAARRGCLARVVPLPGSPLRNVPLVRCIGLYGSLALATVLIDELFPVIAKLSAARGGLGLTEAEIGQCLVIQGVCLVTFQLFVFHRLVAAAGEQLLFRVAATAMVVLYAAFPLLLAAATAAGPASLWPVVTLVMLVKTSGLGACFSLTFVFINAAARGHSLGAVNGIGQSVASAMRALGPTIGGAVFSASLRLGPVWLHTGIVSIMMALLMIVTLVNVSTLPAWITESGLDRGRPAAAAAHE